MVGSRRAQAEGPGCWDTPLTGAGEGGRAEAAWSSLNQAGCGSGGGWQSAQEAPHPGASAPALVLGSLVSFALLR